MSRISRSSATRLQATRPIEPRFRKALIRSFDGSIMYSRKPWKLASPADPALRRYLGAGLIDARRAVAATTLAPAALDRAPEDVLTPPEPETEAPGAMTAIRASLLALIIAVLAAAVAATIRHGRRRGGQP